MPKFGNKKEVEGAQRAMFLVNADIWREAGVILKKMGKTRGQYLRSCLTAMVESDGNVKIKWTKKRNLIVGNYTEYLKE